MDEKQALESLLLQGLLLRRDDVAATRSEQQARAAGGNLYATIFAGTRIGQRALGPVGNDILRADVAGHFFAVGQHRFG